MRDLWLSIHPRWVDAIVEGRKTVELRRRAPRVDVGAFALIYATTPTCSVVGSAQIQAVVSLPLEELWTRYGRRAAISRSEFCDYFRGTAHGSAIELASVQTLDTPVGLRELRDRGVQPAQGWRYLPRERLEELLEVRSFDLAASPE